MAQTQMCSNDDGNAAVMLVSNLTNGETEAWCPDCLPIFAMSVLGLDADTLAGLIEMGGETEPEPEEGPGPDAVPFPDGAGDTEPAEATPAPTPESVEEPTPAGQ